MATQQLLQECLPLLQCFAENITHTGAVGSGHRMKLLHNYVSLGSVTLLAEAGACAERSGVAPAAFVDVLAKGGGGGVALERLRPYLLAQDPGGLRFSMSNALKDMGYYSAMARDGEAARGIAQAVHDSFALAVADGGPQRLVPELVMKFLRKKAANARTSKRGRLSILLCCYPGSRSGWRSIPVPLPA